MGSSRPREIEFFVQHHAADVEHSRRQGEALCAKYLDTPDIEARALKVAEEMCILRWASITDLYRQEVLLEEELPPGVG